LLDRIRRPAIAAANVRLWNISQQEATVFLKEYGAELPPRKRNLLQAFLRCQTSKSRFVRVATFLRYGFYYVGLKPNLAMLIYLWTLHAEQQ
jgi:hypothetical protein